MDIGYILVFWVQDKEIFGNINKCKVKHQRFLDIFGFNGQYNRVLSFILFHPYSIYYLFSVCVGGEGSF